MKPNHREAAVEAAQRAIFEREDLDPRIVNEKSLAHLKENCRVGLAAARPHERAAFMEELLSGGFCDRVLDELVVIAGGKRGFTDSRVPFARWDMQAALRAAFESIGEGR